MNNTTQGFYIGSHRFDRQAQVWSGPQGEYRLAPDAASVIDFLVAHAGEPVRRDQIIDSVWAGKKSADRLLTLSISSLRRSLGDSTQHPRYIETVPGYGYRLVAPVRPLQSPAIENNSPVSPTVREKESSRLWQFLLELRQRKVCRAALMYSLTIWLICQVAEVIFEALKFPDWALPLVVVAGILGLPIALILAWIFEVTPTGLALDIPTIDKVSGKRALRDTRWNYALLAASVLVSIQMLIYLCGLVEPTQDGLERLRHAESIIVTPFQATNVSLETKAYAFALSEEVRYLLRTEYRLDVISADALTGLTVEQKKADLLLEGSVYIAHGETQIMVHLVDPADGYDLWSDIILIPRTGTADSQHEMVRTMLHALPIGDAFSGDEPDAVASGAD